MLKLVALGGGHGLAATLTSLRSVTEDITAIVTVADDGGSSGRLRRDFGVIPPGDLRMALAALCADDEWGNAWAQAIQYRFPGDEGVGGHALGNLMLTALWNSTGDVVLSLEQMGNLLKVKGRVLPMAAVPLTISATVNLDSSSKAPAGRVEGQVAVATTSHEIVDVELLPHNPPATLEAITAISNADWITLGPGSWYSSVIPHLLVPDQLSALVKSKARKVLIMNLDAGNQDADSGEAAGLTATRHFEILLEHAPGLKFDYVIVDPSSTANPESLRARMAKMGCELVLEDVSAGNLHHDPAKLAGVLKKIFLEK